MLINEITKLAFFGFTHFKNGSFTQLIIFAVYFVVFRFLWLEKVNNYLLDIESLILQTILDWGRLGIFACTNIGLVYCFYFSQSKNQLIFYLSAVSFCYLLIWLFSRKTNYTSYIPLFFPVIILILYKLTYAVNVQLFHWIGVSYMMFRIQSLSIEIRNGVVKLPNILCYFSFCFFVPTLAVGPISPYSNFQSIWQKEEQKEKVSFENLLRIIIGYIKFTYIGAFLSELLVVQFKTFPENPGGQLFFIGLTSLLSLYFSFSGFCDMTIGFATLLNIDVKENFKDPLFSVSIKDFWSRWHISLTQHIGLILFNPTTKFLFKRFPKSRNISVGVGIFLVFTVIGIWHGFTLGYLLFGITHALGSILHYAYGIAMGTLLGRRYISLKKRMLYKAVSFFLTFIFVSYSFFFFAANPSQLQVLFGYLTK